MNKTQSWESTVKSSFYDKIKMALGKKDPVPTEQDEATMKKELIKLKKNTNSLLSQSDWLFEKNLLPTEINLL